MNKNNRRISGDKGVSKKDITQRGARIANRDQIEFLISLLQKHSAETFYNDEGKYTKDSAQPLADLYMTSLAGPNNNTTQLPRKRLKPIGAESIFNLIQIGNATRRNNIIYQLAGLALFLENKIADVVQCAQLILKGESWNVFLKQFKKEIGLTESFIFYYWKKGVVNIAKFHLKLNSKKTNWEDCRIYYYDYDEQDNCYKLNEIQTDVHIVDQDLQLQGHNFFAFYVLHDWQVAQYNIPVPSDIPRQKYFFCSYSSYSRLTMSFAGVGILYNEKNVEEKIKEINAKKNIDPGILNLLHEKTIALPYSTNLNRLPNHKQVEKIKKISGLWKIYSLRNNKPDDGSPAENKGGIEVNYLFIKPDGSIYLKCDENFYNNYEGFLIFPLAENNKLVKCNILESPTDNVYKIHMLLHLKQNGKILEGIVSGWSNRGNPYGSLIRLQKERDFNELNEKDFSEYKPFFIKKSEIVSFPEIDKFLVTFFSNRKKYLDLFQDCFPSVVVENKTIFSSIAGCYYLLSRDYEEGLIDKAKLEIFKDGNFKADYPDVSYKGIVKEFVTTVGNDQHIYLDVLQKKLSIQAHWTNFSGAFLFNMENILITNKDALSQKIDFIAGFSLRKNASKLSQVKKEFLIPAKDVQKFYIEEPDKYSYSFEKKLLYNLKANSNHHNSSVDYHKLIRAIRGKENNIMLLSNQHSITNIQRETDYFDVYMSAFLFEVIFVPSLNFNKIYDYLLQSLLHLTDSKQLFNKLDSVFLKYHVEEKIKNEIIRSTNILFKAIIVESNNGNLSSLIEKIKSLNLESSRIPLVKKINQIIQKMSLVLNK